MKVWRIEYKVQTGKNSIKVHSVDSEGETASLAIADAECRLFEQQGEEALNAFQGSNEVYVRRVAELNDGKTSEVLVPQS